MGEGKVNKPHVVFSKTWNPEVLSGVYGIVFRVVSTFT
jgi:hypothetical protein